MHLVVGSTSCFGRAVVAALTTALRGISDDDLAAIHLNPSPFEKDDDANGHIDFITAASNLRARNYTIKEASRHQVCVAAAHLRCGVRVI